jgi:hypothetical protein
MTRRFIGLVCLSVPLAFAATCNRNSSPTTPTPPAPAANLVGIAISGTSAMQPGRTVSFRRQRRSATGPPAT